jgi:tRNA 5-methylaminomethyl-2-thiouridine biosynthesis bifunctional protein
MCSWAAMPAGAGRGAGGFVILEIGRPGPTTFSPPGPAWAADPARCERLVFISIEAPAPNTADAARPGRLRAPQLSNSLLAAWPAADSPPSLHRLSFEGRPVQLLLCLGGCSSVAARVEVAEVDTFYLDGFHLR